MSFFRFRGNKLKSCSPKNAPKNTTKNTPKKWIFHPNFHRNFRCGYILQKEQQLPPKTPHPKHSARKFHHQRKVKFRVPMWQGWKALNMPIWQAKLNLKNCIFLQLVVLQLSECNQSFGYIQHQLMLQLQRPVELPESSWVAATDYSSTS